MERRGEDPHRPGELCLERVGDGDGAPARDYAQPAVGLAQFAAPRQASGPVIGEGETAGAFATVEVEERHSAVIEGRGVTVRLEGVIETAGIVLIAVALAGSR